MSDAVLVALIGFGGTVFTATTAIVTQIILNKRNREKRRAESLLCFRKRQKLV